jgi:hypothetical protein
MTAIEVIGEPNLRLLRESWGPAVAEARKTGAVTDRHFQCGPLAEAIAAAAWRRPVALCVAAVMFGRLASRLQSISIEPGCEGGRLTTC